MNAPFIWGRRGFQPMFRNIAQGNGPLQPLLPALFLCIAQMDSPHTLCQGPSLCSESDCTWEPTVEPQGMAHPLAGLRALVLLERIQPLTCKPFRPVRPHQNTWQALMAPITGMPDSFIRKEPKLSRSRLLNC